MESSSIDINSLYSKIGKLLFVAAIGYCLFADSELSAHRWYSQEVIFSDWRGIPPVDYSTNVPLSNWYSGHPAKYFRQENLQQFIGEPDTVTLGIDYYAFYPISCNLAASFVAKWEVDTLLNGGVLVAKSIHGKFILHEKR